MPYIHRDTRKEVDAAIDTLVESLQRVGGDENPGVLNYTLFATLVRLFGLTQDTNYGKIHLIDGVLSNVGREIYDRFARPYENQKIRENGDVQ